jgi:hypothetical protein
MGFAMRRAALPACGRLVIALAALVLLRADMYPDASNAKLPEARINLGLPLSAEDIGFVGDAATAAITTTAGSATFSPALPASAIGKAIIVPGAGTGGNPHTTTVATTTTFAAPAVLATSASTFYAEKGRGCPVATPQAGAGNYAPLDTITLSGGVVCTVTYTQIVGTPTIVAGGSGCTNGSGKLLRGTTGTGHAGSLGYLAVFATIAGGTVTAIESVSWAGRYKTNPANLANEPVTGNNCTGTILAIPKMGVAYAHVTTPGGVAPKPADPVASSATSGSGTGAAFTMTDVWRQAGEAHYGTDNSAAMTALAARTDAPQVHFPAGNYLLNCDNYVFSSAASLLGEARHSILRLFPYCSQTGSLLQWNQRDGVTIDGMTFDANRSYGTSAYGYQAMVTAYSGNNFRYSNNSMINLPTSQAIGLHVDGYTPNPVLTPVIRDNYFNSIWGEGRSGGSALSVGGYTSGTIGGLIAGNIIEGSTLLFCLDNGVVSNNQVSGSGGGAGIYEYTASVCRNTLVANNVARDSLSIQDVDQTIISGFELNGTNTHVVGNQAYRNAGNGFRVLTTNGFLSGNVAWSNNKYTAGYAAFPALASGFVAIGPDASGTTFTGNRAYDAGDGTQSYGYAEIGASLPNLTVTGNHFAGVVGPVGQLATGNSTPAVAVSALPTCNTSRKYQTQPVSDQLAAPTYRGALTGGGVIAALAYCNGSSWEAH